MLRQTIGWNPERKANALDTGKIRLCVEALCESPPFITGNIIGSVEKSSSTEQNLFVGFKPGGNPGPDFVAPEYELPLRLNIHIRFDVKGGDGGDNHEGNQDPPCRPNSTPHYAPPAFSSRLWFKGSP